MADEVDGVRLLVGLPGNSSFLGNQVFLECGGWNVWSPGLLLGRGGVEAVAMETGVARGRWGLLVVMVDRGLLVCGFNLLLWHPNLVVSMVT